MSKNKVISADEAIALVRDGDVVCTTGFVQSCIPEALHAALERRYVQTKAPKDLTLIMCAGAGDSKGLGTGRLHHEGLLKRVIAANFGRMPKVAQAAQENKIQGYNLPQGIISKLYRSCASGQPGLFSKVGLQTYVDPRLGGGKVNSVTTEDMVKLEVIDGREWLFYKATPIDVALIHNHNGLHDTRIDELLSLATARGIGIIAASPFGSGLLTEKGAPAWHPATPADRQTVARAAQICRAAGTSIMKLAFQFAVQRAPVATTLFSAADPASVRRCVQWAAEPFDPALVELVRAELATIIDRDWY